MNDMNDETDDGGAKPGSKHSAGGPVYVRGGGTGAMTEPPVGPEVVEITRRAVQRSCWYMQTADQQDIEGVVLLAYARLLTVGPPDKLKAWINGVVSRRSARWLRDRGRHRIVSLFGLMGENDGSGESGCPSSTPAARPEPAGGWEGMIDDLALHLSAQEQADFRAMLAGDSCADVARREGVPQDRVERRWRKIRESLRKWFA